MKSIFFLTIVFSFSFIGCKSATQLSETQYGIKMTGTQGFKLLRNVLKSGELVFCILRGVEPANRKFIKHVEPVLTNAAYKWNQILLESNLSEFSRYSELAFKVKVRSFDECFPNQSLNVNLAQNLDRNTLIVSYTKSSEYNQLKPEVFFEAKAIQQERSYVIRHYGFIMMGAVDWRSEFVTFHEMGHPLGPVDLYTEGSFSGTLPGQPLLSAYAPGNHELSLDEIEKVDIIAGFNMIHGYLKTGKLKCGDEYRVIHYSRNISSFLKRRGKGVFCVRKNISFADGFWVAVERKSQNQATTFADLAKNNQPIAFSCAPAMRNGIFLNLNISAPRFNEKRE